MFSQTMCNQVGWQENLPWTSSLSAGSSMYTSKASQKRSATGNVFKTGGNREGLEEGMPRLRGVEKHPRKGQSVRGFAARSAILCCGW